MTTKVEPTVEKWEFEWRVYDKKLKRVVDDAELMRIVKRAYRAKETMVLPFDIDSLAITQDGRIFVIDDTGETMWLDPKRYSVQSHSVQEAKAESYKKALDDMFLEIYKLAEPDEGQPSAGDLHTNMDDIHNIRTKLSTLNTKEKLL